MAGIAAALRFADGNEAESANADDTPPIPAGGRLSPPATLKPAKTPAARKDAGAPKATASRGASPAEDAAAARDAANGAEGDKPAEATGLTGLGNDFDRSSGGRRSGLLARLLLGFFHDRRSFNNRSDLYGRFLGGGLAA